VTGVGEGTARVIATIDGVTGERSITIIGNRRPSSPLGVERVAVHLSRTSLVRGDSATATATAYDTSGVAMAGIPVVWSIDGSPSVVTVSATGLVTAVGGGVTHVAAAIDGVLGVETLTVVDTVTATAAFAPPELPRTYLSFSYPTVTGRTWVVRAGDNLQLALNGAQRGDEIVLDAGATFTGNFALPAKGGTPADGWIVVRSSALGTLPAAGTRVTPAAASLMPRLMTANSSPALRTSGAASGWWLAGLEVTVDPAFVPQQYGIMVLGATGAAQDQYAESPTDLVLDRLYLHGATTTNTSRCLEMNSARTAVQDSYLTECHGKGFDSQAIVGWNGAGPFRIVNNTLAGAGENVMFGGADPSIAGLIPSDIEIRGNFIYTPVAWKGTWTKKNLLETKNAQRLLVEGNVIDGSWADGQSGVGLALKSANQSGKCTWCATRDVTIRMNVIRNMALSFSLDGKEGSSPNPVGERMTRVSITDNVVSGINVAPYVGDAKLLQVMQNVSNLVVSHNTWDANSADVQTFLTLGAAPAASNFVYESNVVPVGRYGMIADRNGGSGADALLAVAGTARFSGNTIYGGAARAGYPASTVFVSTLALARLVPGAGADLAAVALRTNSVLQQ
jgi:hypothetical protein